MMLRFLCDNRTNALRPIIGVFQDLYWSVQQVYSFLRTPSAPIPSCPEPSKPGYHLRPIKKGQLGKISKIQEELDELADAEQQDVRIMQLIELSDLVGAIEAYLKEHLPGYTILDLQEMSEVTKRAFVNGHR